MNTHFPNLRSILTDGLRLVEFRNIMQVFQKTADKKESSHMDTFASIMETLMVVCFGISWPLNIVKAWKSHSAKGISLPFYSMIWIGYVFALVGKFVMIANNAPLPWYETVHWYVMFFYIVNILMVTAGILIYFRNKHLDKLPKEEEVITVETVERTVNISEAGLARVAR